MPWAPNPAIARAPICRRNLSNRSENVPFFPKRQCPLGGDMSPGGTGTVPAADRILQEGGRPRQAGPCRRSGAGGRRRPRRAPETGAPVASVPPPDTETAWGRQADGPVPPTPAGTGVAAGKIPWRSQRDRARLRAWTGDRGAVRARGPCRRTKARALSLRRRARRLAAPGTRSSRDGPGPACGAAGPRDARGAATASTPARCRRAPAPAALPPATGDTATPAPGRAASRRHRRTRGRSRPHRAGDSLSLAPATGTRGCRTVRSDAWYAWVVSAGAKRNAGRRLAASATKALGTHCGPLSSNRSCREPSIRTNSPGCQRRGRRGCDRARLRRRPAHRPASRIQRRKVSA